MFASTIGTAFRYTALPKRQVATRAAERSEIQPRDEDNGVTIEGEIQVDKRFYVDAEQVSPEVIDEQFTTELVDDFDLLAPPPAQLYTRISDLDRINLDKYRTLGEAIWRLYVRATTLFPPREIYVEVEEQRFFNRAETESVFLDRLSAMPGLNEQETALIQRSVTYMGYLLNAPERFKSDVNSSLWMKSCTLECMLGYWYQTNPVRLEEVMEWLGMGKMDKLRRIIPYRQLWRLFQKQKDNEREMLSSEQTRTSGFRRMMYIGPKKVRKDKLLARGMKIETPGLPKDFKR